MNEVAAQELIDESFEAINVLRKLISRLEIFTDQVEDELARRSEDGGSTGGPGGGIGHKTTN